MADWYVSSVAYAAIPQWAASTAYTVGQFVRALATPSQPYQYYVHRCTTAGTTAATEPAWTQTLNGTTTSGSATFTNVTSQATYGWSAAANNLYTLSNAGFNFVVPGDRIFVSSDHNETYASGVNLNFGGAAGFGLVQILSVNRAGSVPPVAADLLSGAAVTMNSGTWILDAPVNMFWHGFTFTYGGTNFWFNNSYVKSQHFKNCAFVMTATSAFKLTANSYAKVIWENTTVQFAHVGQSIGGTSYAYEFSWFNTPSAIQGATIPTALFGTANNSMSLFTCRGVDLSAITGTLVTCSNSFGGVKVLLESCRINSAALRYALPATNTASGDEVELVNCYDGTNVLNERYTAGGAVTIDRSTTVSAGAQDDIGSYTLKMASSARSDNHVGSLHNFQFDVENTAVGASKTATVEIASAAALNNIDVKLLLEYMGTSGSPIASFVDSLATVLTPAAALPASAASWSYTPSFATWNPTDALNMTFSNGNRTVTSTSSSPGAGARAVVGYTGSGKYYWEITATQWTSNSWVGLLTAGATMPGSTFTGGIAAALRSDGAISINAAGAGTLGGRANGDVIGIAVDFGANLIWFRVAPAGNWNGSGTANPATGTGGANIAMLTGVLFPYTSLFTSGDNVTANFGASAFSGTVPSGFTSGLPLSPTNAQKLQVTFTPQRAGRVRGLVRLGKPALTVWVNPQIAIT